MVEQMQRQLQKIHKESAEFGSFFVTTRSIIDSKQQLIQGQVVILTKTIEELLSKIDTLSAVQGVDYIKEHLLVSLRGLKQFQENLQTTAQDLVVLQERCSGQHARIENSQRHCAQLLQKISRKVVVAGSDD